MTLKDELKGKTVKSEDTKSLFVKSAFNKLFKQEREDSEERVGMHGSGIIASDSEFCYRQQVLSFFYKGFEPDIPDGLRRIFLNGWYVHIKWQKLFEQAGIAYGIEKRGESSQWSLLFTPDAIIRLNGTLYVVEIKSMNTFSFKRAIQQPSGKKHPSGTKQCQLYMHMYGIPNGLVLMEDKNTQEFDIDMIKYDHEVARPYVKRMHNVKEYVKRFKDTGKLPSRICEYSGCRRACNCAYKDACFNIRRVLLNESSGD